MSKLQELINKLCPNGVEFKPLGDISNLSRGKVYGKDYISEHRGEYPVFSSQTVNDGELGKIDTYDYDGFYLTWTTDGAYAGTIFYRQGKFSITNVCGLISLKVNFINLKFLYYWLSIEAPKHVYYGMGNPKLMSNQMTSIMIPVPPIEVQEEIVRILDSFSDYAAELQAELQARKQQYEYYRNLLLTFNPSAYGCGTDDEQKDGVTTWGGHNYKIEWKKMGDVFEMRNGYTPSKNNSEFWVGGTIPWFRMDDIRENGRILSDSIQHITPSAIKGKGLFEANSFILATTATIGEHALIIADSLANQRFTNLKVRKSLSNLLVTKFIYYYMFIVDDFCKKNTNVSGFASVDMDKLKRMPFPIPPLELQEKIVAILDRFETLVNDLTNGLPAEIAAVKDQYEYYRNKLLTFKKLSA